MFRIPQKLFLFFERHRRGMTLGIRVAVLDGADKVFLPRAERRVAEELAESNNRVGHGKH